MARDKCRLCFSEEDIDKMVSPCNCKGSIKYIHPTCLRQCIHFSNTTKCGVCKTHYVFDNQSTKPPFLQYLYDILSKVTLLVYSLIIAAILYNKWKGLLILNAIFAITPAFIIHEKYKRAQDLEQKMLLREYRYKYWINNITNICHSYMALLLSTIINIGVYGVVANVMGESEIVFPVMQWIALSGHTYAVLYCSLYYYLKNIEFNDEFLFID